MDYPKEVAEVWKMNDPRKGILEFGFKAGEGPKLPENKPEWMLNFSRTWPNPSGPVIMMFTLKPGYEQEAIDFLYNNEPEVES